MRTQWLFNFALFVSLTKFLTPALAAPYTELHSADSSLNQIGPSYDAPTGLPLGYELGQEPLQDPAIYALPEVEQVEGMSRQRIAELMRPTFGFEGEWQSETNDIELSSYGASIQVPTYPIFGPPPPLIRAGYLFTRVDAPESVDLPDALHDYSLGFTWIRRINERWLMRFMASAAFATDGNNQSSDAWRFRGGAFAMYRPRPDLTWIFGALALGRNDIPVVPAVGLIWQPRDDLRFDVTLPKPRIACLVAETSSRQQWLYVGAGLNGGTWGYQRDDGTDDQLTYGDWRWVVGWESTPTLERGMPFARGRKVAIEAGYVFSRDFEYESDELKLRLDDTWMLRGTISL